MTTPWTTASALAAPARDKTVTTVAECRRKGCQERLERFTQRACARPGRPLEITGRLVPVTEYGVMTAAPEHTPQMMAHQLEQVLVEATPATRRPRPSRPR